MAYSFREGSLHAESMTKSCLALGHADVRETKTISLILMHEPIIPNQAVQVQPICLGGLGEDGVRNLVLRELLLNE